MGNEYRICFYKRMPDNTEFAHAYSELPNRYSPMVTYWTGNSQLHYPIDQVFLRLLKKKAGDTAIVNYVKVLLEDFPFLFDELAKLNDIEFSTEYPRARVTYLLQCWREHYMKWSTEVEMYFFW